MEWESHEPDYVKQGLATKGATERRQGEVAC